MDTLFTGQTGATALGVFWLALSEKGLVAVEWGRTREEFEAYLTRRFKRPLELNPVHTREAALQLKEYLASERRDFSLEIDWSVLRPFQCAVLRATQTIPFGETRTYKEIALQVGSPRGARAVGRAEATNPMPLVLPCHRVVGRDGKLHGYGMAEGLKTKAWLLKLEGAVFA